MLPGIIPQAAFMGRNLGPASVTVGTAQVDNTGRASYSFTGVDFGTPHAKRVIVVVLANADNLASVGSVTIGGIAATVIARSQATAQVYLAYANVPTGTSGTVAVTMSTTPLGMTMIPFVIDHVQQAAARDSVTDAASSGTGPLTGSLSVYKDGVAIAACVTEEGSATITWANITEVYEGANLDNKTTGAAAVANSSTTTLSPSASFSVNAYGQAFVAASWK